MSGYWTDGWRIPTVPCKYKIQKIYFLEATSIFSNFIFPSICCSGQFFRLLNPEARQFSLADRAGYDVERHPGTQMPDLSKIGVSVSNQSEFLPGKVGLTGWQMARQATGKVAEPRVSHFRFRNQTSANRSPDLRFVLEAIIKPLRPKSSLSSIMITGWLSSYFWIKIPGRENRI